VNSAPHPARGTYEDGFEHVARTFARQLEREELGASFCAYHRGRCVVDLYGGVADPQRGERWREDTRVVLFSVTKGLASMAFTLLADRGALDYDAPVATYWPGFARAGKGAITVATLLGHRGGLCALDRALTMDDCVRPDRYAALVESLEAQRPLFTPERDQGYHAITFGMYARELFERIAKESLGTFLARELFEPLEAEVSLGTPAIHDERTARLVAPRIAIRLGRMALARIQDADSVDARVGKQILDRESLTRRAFLNPSLGKDGPAAYDRVEARRAELAWASATGTARISAVRHGRGGGRSKVFCGAYDRAVVSPARVVVARSCAPEAARLVAWVLEGRAPPLLSRARVVRSRGARRRARLV
jgi:CubicO group peptidase (beta-lactamase class C family)